MLGVSISLGSVDPEPDRGTGFVHRWLFLRGPEITAMERRRPLGPIKRIRANKEDKICWCFSVVGKCSAKVGPRSVPNGPGLKNAA
jgi:hypothetical protein